MSLQRGHHPAQRRADIDLALRAAAAAGIGLVHENGGRILSSADDFHDVIAAGERGDGPQTLGYWAQLVATEEEARDTAALLGAHGLGGDLNIDGSIGSRTAHLREPYADADGHCGNPYLPVEQVRDHIAACSQAGIQAGFHVIGDAGVRTAIAGIGRGRPGRRRHRAPRPPPARAPRDDRRRGSPDSSPSGSPPACSPPSTPTGAGGACMPRGWAASALGHEPFRHHAVVGDDAGAGLGLARDPFAPWEAVRACVNHQNPEQRVSARSAFLAHTRGGWRAAGFDDRGYLDLGQPASFAVWRSATSSSRHPTTASRPGAPIPARAPRGFPT